MGLDDCVFCKIIKGEIPAKKEYEDEKIIVIHDLHPRAPVHLLVIPKSHRPENIAYLEDQDKELLWKMLMVANRLVKKFGLNQKGFIYRFNGGGYQHINHLHLWLVGGSKLEPMTENPPNFKF